MSALIPIISKKEFDQQFLENATKDASEVFLLAIIDTSAPNVQFGLATSEISHANELIEKISTLLKTKGLQVQDALEWGDTKTKIINFAKLKKVKKVALVKQNSQYFHELTQELEQNKIKVEIF